MGDYARALAAGSDLPAPERAAIAEKLHEYTGLPVAYILKADLRIDGGEFRQTLQGEDGMTTGPPRYPLRRTRHRSLEPARELRPAVRRVELRLRIGVQ